MKPVESTIEILLYKILGYNVDKRWVNWAYDMMVAGFESESLVLLAGEIEPYNQFELQHLTDKVFSELGLEWNDRDKIYKSYARHLLRKNSEGRMDDIKALAALKDIYINSGYEPPYHDFYDLYYAQDALKDSADQWYLPYVTRENIKQTIKACFDKWLNDCN